MAHSVLSPNGEESYNIFLSPNPDTDPDHLRGGPSHECNTYCVTKTKSIGAIVFELRVRTDIQTNIPICITLTLRVGSEGNDGRSD